MPDIDVDFSYDRRDEVIAYVVNKYGTDRVAQIITFGTMAARAAVRDVGRVLGVSPQIVDRVAKMIPSEPGITLEKAVRKNTQLQQAVEENPQVEKLMQLARAVEGLPRHASTHAAGVIISREPLTHYVPLQQGHENHALTQYSMESLEDVGLLKMDFLGLRNLTLLEYAVRMIEEQEGKRIDLSRLPLDDERTYRMLADADTSGVFQLESSGMRHVLREVRPSGFEDIVAVLALFRPGPMEFIPEFAATKHGKKQITYLHPVLEPILKDTYGFILYQEQIMQIASSVAGFTLGEADILRRAVSKKKKELLQEQRDKFIAGSLRQGYDKNLSNRLYDLIVRFADYGFNRSHSAAYGLIAYQMAYLKANHPVSFMASLLAISQGSIDKTAEYVEECKRRSIPVLPPDVNCSSVHFTVEGDSIRFGLGAIKNVGIQAVRAIVEERRRKPFKDLYDFCLRIDQRICNKRVLEALVLSGAMDSFPGHRAAFLAGLDEALSWSQKMRREKEQSQLGLFGENQEGANSAPVLSSAVQPFQQKEMLEQERELLGFHLSGHPMDEYAQVCRHPSVTPLHRLGEMKDKQDVRLIGMVSAVRSISTKKGQPMAFVQLEDKMSNAEIVVFPGVYGQAAHLLKKGRLLVIEGKADCQGEDVKCIADRIKDINELKPLPVEEGSSDSRRNVFIKIEKRIEENSRQLGVLQNILLRAPGVCPVILYYASKKQYVRLSADHSIEPNAEMVRKIEEIVGSGQIIVKSL
jgi:DNA polymerase III subunit alpha